MPEVIQKYTSGEMSGNPGGLIRWPVWVAIPVGVTLLMLQGWSELIKRIAFLTGERSEPFSVESTKSEQEQLAEELAAEAARHEQQLAEQGKR